MTSAEILLSSQVAERLIMLETGALERWCNGDPSGFLEICAPDVSYFDPFLRARLDGLPALTAYYESLRGKISAQRFELLNPHVCATGPMACLSFNFVSWGGNENAMRWNCTEVYRHDDEGWRLVQTHWSLTGGNAPEAS